jgi:membrane protein DedA with SNARE-associated domain
MPHWLLQTLESLIQVASPVLHRYGLAALVVVVFAENLGVLVAPGEAVIVTAGFLSARGVFPIATVLILATLAAALGGFAAYGLGFRYGYAGLTRWGKYVRITPARLEKTHRFLHSYGAPVVFFGRFVVPLRQLQGYLAGAVAMGFRPFALWSLLGAVAWVGFWGLGTWWLAGWLT